MSPYCPAWTLSFGAGEGHDALAEAVTAPLRTGGGQHPPSHWWGPTTVGEQAKAFVPKRVQVQFSMPHTRLTATCQQATCVNLNAINSTNNR